MKTVLLRFIYFYFAFEFIDRLFFISVHFFDPHWNRDGFATVRKLEYGLLIAFLELLSNAHGFLTSVDYSGFPHAWSFFLRYFWIQYFFASKTSFIFPDVIFVQPVFSAHDRDRMGIYYWTHKTERARVFRDGMPIFTFCIFADFTCGWG